MCNRIIRGVTLIINAVMQQTCKYEFITILSFSRLRVLDYLILKISYY